MRRRWRGRRRPLGTASRRRTDGRRWRRARAGDRGPTGTRWKTWSGICVRRWRRSPAGRCWRTSYRSWLRMVTAIQERSGGESATDSTGGVEPLFGAFLLLQPKASQKSAKMSKRKSRQSHYCTRNDRKIDRNYYDTIRWKIIFEYKVVLYFNRRSKFKNGTRK